MYQMAAYCRLSKDDGENKISESIENQMKLIREYVSKSHGDGKMKPGHQMANMCGGRAMKPNLRNIPFVIDPFALKR